MSWKLFGTTEYKDAETIADRSDRFDKQVQKDRIRQLRRSVKEEARKKRLSKSKEQELWNEQYHRMMTNHYGAPEMKMPHELAQMSEGHGFGLNDKKSYQQEIENRYSQQYHWKSDKAPPQLNRGIGALPHQRVSSEGQKRYQAPLDKLGSSVRVAPGTDSNQSGSSSSSSSIPPLKRPF